MVLPDYRAVREFSEITVFACVSAEQISVTRHYSIVVSWREDDCVLICELRVVVQRDGYRVNEEFRAYDVHRG